MKKKHIDIIVIASVIVLICGIVIGLYSSGLFKGKTPKGDDSSIATDGDTEETYIPEKSLIKEGIQPDRDLDDESKDNSGLPQLKEEEPDDTEDTGDTDKYAKIRDSLQSAYAINSDLVGWVKVPGTNVDDPVVFSGDNEYYLTRDFYKNSDKNGTPFLDMGVDLVKRNRNITIYGHNRKNGLVFSDLMKYKDISQYKKSPVFEFDTLYSEGEYKIFSVFYMTGDANDPNYYYFPKVYFSNDASFMEHVDELLCRSIIKTTVDILPGDQIVLLASCTYETSDLRLVIAGRKVRAGESASVDTEGAAVNKNALYPQKWYDEYGGTAPKVENLLKSGWTG